MAAATTRSLRVAVVGGPPSDLMSRSPSPSKSRDILSFPLVSSHWEPRHCYGPMFPFEGNASQLFLAFVAGSVFGVVAWLRRPPPTFAVGLPRAWAMAGGAPRRGTLKQSASLNSLSSGASATALRSSTEGSSFDSEDCGDPDSWQDRLSFLRDLDLDVVKIVSANPRILSISPETLRVRVETLSRSGLDVAKVVGSCPRVLDYGKERISGHIAFLKEVGLDSVRVINAFPSVLCFNVDTKLRPNFRFLTFEIDRDISELQRNPACLGMSLDGRLRPRHAFATLHSKQHASFRTLFAYTDRKFARLVGVTYDDYQTWLRHHRDPLHQ